MTTAEWAAWIGALAWAPQIASWIIKLTARPTLRLFSAPTIELGYTSFGPIINMTCSVSACRKDAVIEKATMEVVHRNGDKRVLTWKILMEIQQQITGPSGLSLEISKNQPAITLKVPTVLPIEKKVGFQDLDFQAEFRQYSSKVLDTYNYLIKKDASSDLPSLKSSKDFIDLIDFFKKSMYWKEGQYTITVALKEISSEKVQETNFRFSLANHEIETLKRNLDLLEKDIQTILEPAQEEDKKSPSVYWGWVYPEITRL